MSDSILLHVEAGLARVTFNRPDRLNAMDFAMGERWRDVARQVTSDPAVGAIVIDAVGPAFCAGGDVMMMATSGADGSAVTDAAHVIHAGIRAFVESDTPVVAAVQGAVAGGGLGLMLTADYIVAAEGAKFVSRYANIGLTPDLGVSTLLPAAIGQRRALQLLLQDRTLSSAEALDWGLIAEIATDPGARADEIARFWLDNATGAFGQAKRLVRTGAHRAFAENLDDEAQTIGAAFDTPDAHARVAAFAAASGRSSRSKGTS
ncbi:enoyl-CoA hydratase/isomerase family protein [Microbacterium sp. cx-55]|uniref:enoyl-CoA hydratase/isomerase family protein n=1 Tax=unclassified Microbacterium TaxID=2609290 RepID=UPI001CBFA9C7|nr:MULTISPECIES: enoyl-CoA hydratase/isomerase family protein [unclassified Microbacterium]MBZ4488259.1 enoyl-CoA hydratase/isomerase family protein [Microbacterium sp. cx-55]MCC4909318.1 enoyl-CoA hydratase/isomerase family protein [Microbacterium sp. cx-59]UGB34919.1 enoyl-CoA hydratase/isomerase family protein [Microbacterium sp. cx-55]